MYFDSNWCSLIHTSGFILVLIIIISTKSLNASRVLIEMRALNWSLITFGGPLSSSATYKVQRYAVHSSLLYSIVHNNLVEGYHFSLCQYLCLRNEEGTTLRTLYDICAFFRSEGRSVADCSHSYVSDTMVLITNTYNNLVYLLSSTLHGTLKKRD